MNNNIISSLKTLGIKGKVHIESRYGRAMVIVNGDYYGIWDYEKNTFID